MWIELRFDHEIGSSCAFLIATNQSIYLLRICDWLARRSSFGFDVHFLRHSYVVPIMAPVVKLNKLAARVINNQGQRWCCTRKSPECYVCDRKERTMGRVYCLFSFLILTWRPYQTRWKHVCNRSILRTEHT